MSRRLASAPLLLLPAIILTWCVTAAALAQDVATQPSLPTPKIVLPAPEVVVEGDLTPAPPPLLVPPSNATGETGAILPEPDAIDLQIPTEVGKAIEQAIKGTIERSWLDGVVDDHALLWQEYRDDMLILPRDRNGFGLTTIGFASRWRSEDAPGIWISPQFNWSFVGGPLSPDVRPQLYDLRMELNYSQEFNSAWGVNLQLAPTWATDWDNRSEDAFRIIGGGLLSLSVNYNLKLFAGAMYLDRFDLPVLPMGGFRWQPTDWIEFDAYFPSPRVAWRYSNKHDEQHWLYFGGEFGGGSWAIDHTDGTNDRLAYRDLRCVIGWETRKIDGTRSVFEAGYVFDRHLDFDRVAGDQQLGGTAMIRWGSRY